MDALCDPAVEEVVLMWPAQTGKTEVQINTIGYFVHQDPCPILKIDPTLEMAENFSKTRLAPTIRDSPALKARIADSKSRDSGNTLLSKNYPGGYIAMCGANSPAGLASRPIRIVLPDEIDRFETSAGSEGNPIDLAKQRQNNFFNRKTLTVSTPTIKDASPIEARYLESDQRKFFVSCPKCSHEQVFEWHQVKWPPKQPSKAWYECEHCQAQLSTAQKNRMVAKGQWRSTAEPQPGSERVRGYWLWAIYSPWVSLEDIVSKFLKAKEDPERLKVFINTVLAQTWEEPGAEQLEWEKLRARSETYQTKTVPMEGLLLTAGVDVQGNRLSYTLWAWGEAEECWQIDWDEIMGDPMGDEVWQQLDRVLLTRYPHESGAELLITSAAIDTGYNSNQVYNFVRKRPGRNLLAIKGASTHGKPIVSRPTIQDVTYRGEKLKRGVKLWTIGTDTVKGLLYSRLRIATPATGYIHFPCNLPEDFYKQLCSEKLLTSFVKGAVVRKWKRSGRNEAIDTFIYAYAAATVIGVSRMNWANLRKDILPNSKAFEGKAASPANNKAESDSDIEKPPRERSAAPARDRRRNWVQHW
jgi:phage terminase large subunit GpA-like protein